MTDQEKQIKLALAMGYKRSRCQLMDGPSVKGWDSPDGKSFSVTLDFDPFTDANDCNALIKHLNENGVYQLEVTFSKGRYFVQGFRDGKPTREPIDRVRSYDNWMHGVCTLALKVLDDDSKGVEMENEAMGLYDVRPGDLLK